MLNAQLIKLGNGCVREEKAICCNSMMGKIIQFLICSELRKLKSFFNSLDEDGGGAVSIDELEHPLIGLGFAETK